MKCATAALMMLALYQLTNVACAVVLDGPEIYEVTPDEAAAGEVVRINGDHLTDTRDVIFCAGSTTKRASFEVLSDRALDVVVPDYFLPGKSAIVAVVTSHGATVGMPPTAVTVDGSRRQQSYKAPFYHILKGGILQAAGGVTVVEGGGTLSLATSTAGLVLLKKDALLVKYSNAAGLVLYEPGAQFGELFTQNVANTYEPFVARVPVRSISTSLGIEPFLFKAPLQAEGNITGPPRVSSITPPVAGYSGVITLHGRGFFGTKKVLFCNGLHVPGIEAGFQVVSGTELRVVVPDVAAPYNWEFFIVVVNDEGATVTLPPRSRTYLSRPNIDQGNMFYWQNEVECRKTSGGHLFWIGKGQEVNQTGGLVFVQEGGRYAASGAGQLFYEPNAVLPDLLKNSKSAREALALVPSTVPAMFTTLDLRLPGARTLLHAGEGGRLPSRKAKARRSPREAK